MSEQLYRIWMAETEEIGPQSIAALIDRFGSAAHVFAAGREELTASGLLRARQIDRLCEKNTVRAEEILRVCREKGIRVLIPMDNGYPDRLRYLVDPPAVLYQRGEMPDLEQRPGIAIIGTRSCSPSGLTQAEKFSAALTAAGFTVVTGLARGIDSAAARGSLQRPGGALAVFAGGVDLCYPPENSRLLGDLLLHGAVISENPPGTDSAGYRFPRRNRIISGLCAAVLVIEAPIRSGALITAHTALDQGREVFALPGGLDSAASAGSNRLLRDGEAGIVLSPLDLVQELSGYLPTLPDEEEVMRVYRETARRPAPAPQQEQRPKRRRSDPLDREYPPSPTIEELLKNPRPIPPLESLKGDEKLVAEAVRDGADSMDAITDTCGLPTARCLSALTLLEIDGVVCYTAGVYHLACATKTMEDTSCQNS